MLLLEAPLDEISALALNFFHSDFFHRFLRLETFRFCVSLPIKVGSRGN